MNKINVAVSGAAGKMGRNVVAAIAGCEDLHLSGAVDLIETGSDAGKLAGLEPLGVIITSSLEKILQQGETEVLVDFTTPMTIMKNIETSLRFRVTPVVGTTGISERELAQIEKWVTKYHTGAIIIPNFALGAVLMMKLAQICARFFPQVEIIELHHNGKIDAPSGTAIKTAQLITSARRQHCSPASSLEKIPGARGGDFEGIHIHSVRLPGLVAHQEIIFGGEGQILTIKHESLNRRSFLPGIIEAIRKAPETKQLVYGMENLLDI
ncbi:MAG TPA: 4-hydroxy-tetrahydrodipicolinate reductase [Firmicutes bacterium]|nr:4-hydroxy-tetrahydrodipicolinate reductase [Bacillota bacterium]